MADFKRPEPWTPEKDQEENDLDIIIDNDIEEEKKDPDILEYYFLIDAGLL